MDYAAALIRGRGGGEGAAPRPAVAPAPVPVAAPTPAAAPAPVVVQAIDPKEAAGPFGLLTTEVISKIAIAAGPNGLSNLGVSCKLLSEIIVKGGLWKHVKSQVAAPKKASVQFRIEAGSDASTEANDEDATEVLPGSDSVTVPLSQLKTDADRSKLVRHWLESVSQAQSSRSDGPLQVRIGGGFVIEQRGGKQQSKRIYTSTSLADVHSIFLDLTTSWLRALVELLKGKTKSISFNVENGRVSLQRYARGGSQIIVKFESERAVFDFADFVVLLRKTAKQFIPLVLRAVVLLKSAGSQETNPEGHIERETLIKNILKPQELDQLIKTIKNLLETGAVPGSNFAALLADKRAERQRAQVQASREYEHMWEFVLNNLPSDFATARLQAEQLTEEAEAMRDAARAQREAERQRRFEERKAAEAAKRGEVSVSTEADKKKKEKAKKVKLTTVDRDGFKTQQVVKASDVDAITAAAAAIPEPEPEPQVSSEGKKKRKKGKKGASAATTPTAAVSAPAPKDEPAAAFLEENPYSAALLEDKYESAVSEIVARQQKKGSQTAALRPPAPRSSVPSQPVKKTDKVKKPQAKKAKPVEKRVATSAPVAGSVAEQEWFAPVLVVATTAVAIAFAYYQLIGL